MLTREEFRDLIKRRFGWPIVNVELEDIHIDDILDENGNLLPIDDYVMNRFKEIYDILDYKYKSAINDTYEYGPAGSDIDPRLNMVMIYDEECIIHGIKFNIRHTGRPRDGGSLNQVVEDFIKNIRKYHKPKSTKSALF